MQRLTYKLKRLTEKTDGIFVIVLGLFSLFIWINRQYFSIPDPDIFQYIADTNIYLQGRIPKHIQIPPLFSILIGILAKGYVHNNTPEISSAHTLNAIASIVTIICIFFLFRNINKWIAFFISLVVLTNPVFVFSSLNTNTEIIYTALTLVSILLYQKKLITLTYLLTGVAFLVRYEAILLFGTIFAADTFTNYTSLWTNIRKAIPGMCIIVAWLSVIYFHNPVGNIFGNEYIQEVARNRHNIPQFGLILRTPYILVDKMMYDLPFSAQKLLQFVLIVVYAALYIFIILKSDRIIKLISIYSLIYLFFHMLFPYSPDRYIIPVLWILYALPAFSFYSKENNSRWLVVFFLLCLVAAVTNTQKIYEIYNTEVVANKAFPKNFRVEVLLAAKWLNSQTFNNKTFVVTYEPWIMKYYTTNNMVNFIPVDYQLYQQCDSVLCLIDKYNLDTTNSAVLFIKQSNHTITDNSFPSSINFKVETFNNFPNDNEKMRFTLVTKRAKTDSWVEVYQLTNR